MNMKKLIGIIAVCALALGQAVADEYTTDITKLPETIRSFVNNNFPQVKVAGIKIDKELLSVEDYKVALSDGTQLEFLPDGTLKEIENKFSGIDLKLIPQAISEYVSKNYAGAKIVEFKKKLYGYETELSNGIELKFSPDGKFLGMDM